MNTWETGKPGASEKLRGACAEAASCFRASGVRVLDQPRSSQRYHPRPREGEAELVKQHPRYGYRFVWTLLRAEGFKVNRKRVYRLWRRQGLKVPVKWHKWRRLGTSENGIGHLSATHPDHVWAWDFVHDRTEDGRPLKFLCIVDEFTRECLAFEVRRSFKSRYVIEVLKELFLIRGTPAHIRSDNGPAFGSEAQARREFIARAIGSWLGIAKVKTLYIEPGSPWENGYIKSFNSRVRDELLESEMFTCLAEASPV